MADDPATVLREELARARPGWPRDAGVLAAASTEDTTAYHAIGTTDAAGTGPTPRTLYRIASISKVFTALALALAVRRGDLSLDEPAQPHLPAPFRLPRHPDGPILVGHLATHTAGLPHHLPADPSTEQPSDSAQGFAGALARLEPTTPPGQVYRYSNVGVSLLGLLLARTAGTSYAELVADRVCRPLGLDDTTLTPDPAQLRRLATGRAGDGSPTATPTVELGAPSGGFYSTATDLLRFLRLHQQGPARGELGAAAALAVEPRFAVGDGLAVGLCWHRTTLAGGAVAVWHNGSLPGYHSYAALLPATGTALVLLANHDVDLETAAGAIQARLG